MSTNHVEQFHAFRQNIHTRKVKIKNEYLKARKINIRTKKNLYSVSKMIFLGSVSLGIRINADNVPNKEQMIPQHN